MHQTFRTDGLKGDTCTAERIHPPEHDYLENTLASMEAAFRLGADIVELDVHPTTDGHFAVFHDWTLDCRTNGKGITREHTRAELQALDIGYGYTADGGKTFPFRGKGVGQMPTLDEVLAAFPDKRLLINIKSDDPDEGRLLADRLRRLPPVRRLRLMVYGGARPIEALQAALPEIRVMSRSSLKSCLVRYLAVGWAGIMPAACRHTLLLVPVSHAHWLWGWPDRFLKRMRAAGTEVFALGTWSGGDFSTGIDDAAELGKLPAGFSGGIWTNRIDRIAPLTAAARSP
jgi:glycerophosphoryl diester phosphodiesterase